VSSPSLKISAEGDGFNRLMVAQDVGSAIKGAERGDIYFGSGEKAGRLAGSTQNAGSFFVLLPAPERKAADGSSSSSRRASWQRKKSHAGR
jgi:membrane-bound lytic murein transglycosylase A